MSSTRLKLITLLAVLGLFGHGRAEALNEREEVINQALNCVSENLVSDNSVSWTDVCYTFASKEAKKIDIKNDLDYYEKKDAYIRQDQYEDSVEYLETFMTEKAVLGSEDDDTGYDTGGYESDYYPMPDLPKIDYKFTREQYQETGRMLKGKFGVYSGYRRDKLNWDIAGNLQGADPNVFAEYEFDKLNMNVIKARGNLVVANRFVLDGYAAYGEIRDGVNQVSEYDGNNRTDLAVRTENKSGGDKIVDISAAMGYRINIAKKDALTEMFALNNLYMTFLAGYSHHEQDMDITDGVTVIDTTPTPELGPFEGLHSSYYAEWEGPFVGLELEGQMSRLIGLLRVEYHLADYYGWGQSNLRPEFQQPKSFEHLSDGNGWVMNLGLGYQLTNNFSLDFLGDLQLWHAKEGVDRLFLPGGTIAEERQLNGVDWESYALMMGGTLRFR